MSTLSIQYFSALKAMVLDEKGYQFVTKAEQAAATEAKKKAKAAGQQPPKEKPGTLLKNLSIDEAMKKLRQKMEDDGPDRDHFPEALEEFRKKKSVMGGSPENFHPSYEKNIQEMQRRYDYSMQCREALLKCFETRINQYQRWNQVAQGLTDIEPGAGPHRWRERLMRLDDTPESRFHNERVVMLSALVDGKIDEQVFKDRRYQAYRDAGKSRREARRLSQEELESPGDCLLEIVRNRIDETNEKMPQIKTAINDILKGNAQDLDAAFRVIEDDGIYLMMNAANVVSDIRDGIKNFAARQDGIKKQVKEWDTVGMTVQTAQEFAEEVANPHYAYLDPQEMRKANIGYLNLDKDDPLGIYVASYGTVMGKATNYGMEPTLNKYGFQESANENMESSDLLVYHQKGKALIFPVESTEWKNGQLWFNVNEEAPGRLVDQNLTQELENYQAEYNKLGVNAESPMAAVGNALAALKGARLGDNPTDEVHSSFTKMFSDLKKASEAYLAANEANLQMAKLAKNLKAFADVKLNQLADVRSHQSLVMMDKAVIDNARRDGDRTKDAMDEVRAEPVQPRRYKETGKKSRSGMANQKIDDFIKTKWKSYVTEKAAAKQHKDIDDFAPKNDAVCKEVLAAQVVQSLVVNEKNLLPNAEDQRVMQEYVISGKLNNLVQMVWNSESFCDQIRCLDLSNRADAEKLMQDGMPKQVAKDIMKNFLDAKRQNQPVNGNPNPQNAVNNNGPVLNNGNGQNGPVMNNRNQPKVKLPG